MAGTILGNIATGVSDWTSWISATELQRKGFLAMSLTNPSGTAASSIGTGSVMELAGSLYQFTETAISLAAGTPSANIGVYYTVIPSAGGTTVTVVMEGTAPTWIDSKQGYYASAGSLIRYIGGCDIKTAGTYINKFLFIPGRIQKKVLEIGEWDMGTAATLSVTHYLVGLNIKHVTALIFEDTETNLFKFVGQHGLIAGTAGVGGGIQIAPTVISLKRMAGGYFETNAFDGTASTVANRGYVFIEYEI